MVDKKNESGVVVMVRDTGGNGTADTYEAKRQARFGALPEHIRLEDTVEEQSAIAPDPRKNAFDSDEWLVRYAL